METVRYQINRCLVNYLQFCRKANLLSIGGRMTLLKSVLGSLGIYYMSLFRVPESILKYLERLRATFFWGGSSESRNISWIKWPNVLASRDKGGLGVGSLKAFNLALLQKWRWRLVNNSNLLWVKLIKSIHRDEAGLYPKVCKTQGVWSKIVASISYLHSNNIIPRGTLHYQLGNGQFGSGKILGTLLAALLSEIHHVSTSSNIDTWIWSLSMDGSFSVRETRQHIDDVILPSLDTPTRWCKSIPIKVNIFTWRAMLDRLPHRLNLSRKGLDIQTICYPICNSSVESIAHILFSCDLASIIWRRVRRWSGSQFPTSISLREVMSWIDNSQTTKDNKV
ncbi:RNA-directed DNA polymerase, eukaryota, reverse transcriptase zinc-binding domain protein [Tanacetum coccineum]|uniref:RNA-directed DNA polymerase, eukaryota, reverse transcriptase zinc-binding domain protein n=1 Tax=Tanacetum coccineum TaxID=301880 RepID=A0ABQ5BVS3_9ASTR